MTCALIRFSFLSQNWVFKYVHILHLTHKNHNEPLQIEIKLHFTIGKTSSLPEHQNPDLYVNLSFIMVSKYTWHEFELPDGLL